MSPDSGLRSSSRDQTPTDFEEKSDEAIGRDRKSRSHRSLGIHRKPPSRRLALAYRNRTCREIIDLLWRGRRQLPELRGRAQLRVIPDDRTLASRLDDFIGHAARVVFSHKIADRWAGASRSANLGGEFAEPARSPDNQRRLARESPGATHAAISASAGCTTGFARTCAVTRPSNPPP